MRLVHSAFPRGLPAAGLLILRIVAGAMVETHGWRLATGPAETPGSRCLGVVAIVLGGAVQIGVFTSISGSLLALGALAAAAVREDELPAGTFAFVSLCIGLALTGPGAMSVDALLFGPREVRFPPVRKGERT
jgi:hypothetical protein